MTEPRDELLERYAEAVAQDPRRPSDRIRNAARAHAQMLRDQTAADVSRVEGTAAKPSAANQPQWTYSLVASLAVVGLAGLMYVQIDRGAPEDREIALGAPAPNHAPAQAPAPAPTAAVTARTDTAQAPLPQPAEAPAPAAHTRPQSQAKLVAAAPPAPTKATQGAAQPTANRSPPPTYSAVPAEADLPAKASGRAAEQIASADLGRDARSENRAESIARAAPGTPAAPAVAAAAAPPPPPAADAQRRARGLTAGTTNAQFLEAARTGDVASLHALIAQGAAINSRDSNGNTALMLAVRHRHGAAVRKLLDMGADTALRNQEGLTALRMAEQAGAADIVQLLQMPR